MSEVKTFMAPGPWPTRDLKPCVLLTDYEALQIQLIDVQAQLIDRNTELATARARLAEAKRRLASITALCGQEGCDGEPYDTFYKVATGEFDPHVRYPATADSASVGQSSPLGQGVETGRAGNGPESVEGMARAEVVLREFAAPQGAITDTDRIAFLERWRERADSQGFAWDGFTIHTDTTVREQIDRQISATVTVAASRE